MSDPLAPEGLRALLTVLGRLVSSPLVRDALRRGDPSLLLHSERVWRQWTNAFQADREAPPEPEEDPRAARLAAILDVARRVAERPCSPAPRVG
jgi:hypothetical protein